jgi:hypothetical protein
VSGQLQSSGRFGPGESHQHPLDSKLSSLIAQNAGSDVQQSGKYRSANFKSKLLKPSYEIINPIFLCEFRIANSLVSNT